MKARLSNSEIKRIRSLSQKKYRDEYGLFVVEGEKLVEEALKSGFRVEAVYRKDSVGEEAMARISQFSTPSPVLAVVRKPEETQVRIPDSGLFLALDTVRDPGNLGTIVRIADWFGINAIFATGDTVDIYNPKVVQATMGAVFRIDFHYCDLLQTVSGFSAKGGKVYGTFLDGENIYGKELKTGQNSPVLMVMGNESEGISPEIEACVHERLYIPSYPPDIPGSESLNVAVATAIAVSEFRRRLY